MPRPRRGDGSRERSSCRNRGFLANPNVVSGVSRGQVVASIRRASVMVYDVIAKDINEDTAIEELEDEEKTDAI